MPNRYDAAQASVQRASSTLDWWDEQANAIERDRSKIQKILPCGGLTALICAWVSPWASAAILAVTLLAWMQGLYLTTVHRWEYAHNIVEARKDLWLAHKRQQACKAEGPPKRRAPWPSRSVHLPDDAITRPPHQ